MTRVTRSTLDIRHTTKVVTFTGAASAGAIGTIPLFTVTGDIICRLISRCSTDLVGATATLSGGTAARPTALMGAEVATGIDATNVVSADAGRQAEMALAVNEYFVGGGADVIATVAVAAITAGVMNFFLEWRPVSADASVVAA